MLTFYVKPCMLLTKTEMAVNGMKSNHLRKLKRNEKKFTKMKQANLYKTKSKN